MAKEKSEKTEDNKSLTAEVVYVPPGDYKAITKIAGLTFHANKPVEVSSKVMVKQLLKHKQILDGRIHIESVEVDVPLIEVLRGNPHFRVDGVQVERPVGLNRLPQTPEEYRGYAIGWIAESTDLASFETRWKVEEGLRQSCGVDANDITYINPVREQKRALLGGSGAIN